MRIWLDFANSPHPILFEPIADDLEARGHEVVVTVRDHAQTAGLTARRWPDAHVVGGPSPDGRAAKARAIAERARRLAAFARRARPDVAVSHNSYAQAVAARLAGVPALTAMDYEHQPANHVAFRAARRVLVPSAFPGAELRRQGGSPGKVRTYEGFKEEVYLERVRPDRGVPRELGLDDGEPYVVARAGMIGATYHPFPNPLFDRALERLVAAGRRIVLLSRRAADLPASVRGRVILPSRPVDGPSLLFHAGAVVGAGGTMNREAALLGTPVISLFAGRLGAQDAALIASGRMRHAGDAQSLDAALAALDGAPASPRPTLNGRVRERFVRFVETGG